MGKDAFYTMDYMEEMASLGANVKEGVGRVMDDQPLYEMMLGMFVETLERDPVHEADFDQSDLDSLIKRVHTLKGITGNLSLTPLYQGYMEALTLLREDQPAKAKAVFSKILPVQEQFVGCIKRHSA